MELIKNVHYIQADRHTLLDRNYKRDDIDRKKHNKNKRKYSNNNKKLKTQ